MEELNPKLARRHAVRRRRRVEEDPSVMPPALEEGVEPGDAVEMQEQEIEEEQVSDSDFAEDEETMDQGLVDDDLLLRAEAMQEFVLSQREDQKATQQPEDARAIHVGHAAGISSSAEQPVSQHVAAVDAIQPEPVNNLEEERQDPEPPEEPKIVRRGGPRAEVAMAEVEVRLANGRIAFHRSKCSFEATCKVHVGCVLSRSQNGRRVKGYGEKQGGRPLGFLAHWLSKASDFDNAADHKHKPFWAGYTHGERSAARQSLALSSAGQRLLALEKPKGSPDDPDEPLELLGLD